MRRLSYATLVAVALFLFVVQAASADVIFDTLNQSAVADVVIVNGFFPFAQGFQVGSGNYYLQDVTLGMDPGTGGILAGGFTLAIYDDSGTDLNGGTQGAPGNLLTTLVGNSNPYVAGNYTYTPSSPFVLNASTTYYVVASSSTAFGQYFWTTTSGAPDVGTGLDGYQAASGWTLGSAYPQLMRVNADPVPAPEPGTLALLLMGLPMGLVWWKRKA